MNILCIDHEEPVSFNFAKQVDFLWLLQEYLSMKKYGSLQQPNRLIIVDKRLFRKY